MVVNIILWIGSGSCMFTIWSMFFVFLLPLVSCFLFFMFDYVSSAGTSPLVKERSSWFVINILSFFYYITKFFNTLLHCSLPLCAFFLRDTCPPTVLSPVIDMSWVLHQQPWSQVSLFQCSGHTERTAKAVLHAFFLALNKCDNLKIVKDLSVGKGR